MNQQSEWATRKYLAFDIETAKLLPETVPNLKEHRPLGISCACAFACDDEKPHLWYSCDNRGKPDSKMNCEDANALVEFLGDQAAAGYTIVTWNGLGFDFDILAEESGRHNDCSLLAWHHVDLMFHVFCDKGILASLEGAAAAYDIPDAKIIDGAIVPRLWATGETSKALEHVKRDCEITLEIAAISESLGVFHWVSERGNTIHLPLRAGWRTVEKSWLRPEPNTSWMSEPPPPREIFTDWLTIDLSQKEYRRTTLSHGHLLNPSQTYLREAYDCDGVVSLPSPITKPFGSVICKLRPCVDVEYSMREGQPVVHDVRLSQRGFELGTSELTCTVTITLDSEDLDKTCAVDADLRQIEESREPANVTSVDGQAFYLPELPREILLQAVEDELGDPTCHLKRILIEHARGEESERRFEEKLTLADAINEGRPTEEIADVFRACGTCRISFTYTKPREAPERRYVTVFGVETDILRCWEHGNLKSFKLGRVTDARPD